jgi:DNA-binding XRE family transcriptional regulator
LFPRNQGILNVLSHEKTPYRKWNEDDMVWIRYVIHTTLMTFYHNVTYRECSYREWPDRILTHSIISLQGRGEMKAIDPKILFGLRLVEIRREKGWSQERLALESGLARSYLGSVERGQRNIALLNIFKLAEALEVAPTVLLEPPVEPVAQPHGRHATRSGRS